MAVRRSVKTRATLWPPKPNELLSGGDAAVGQRARLAADDVERRPSSSRVVEVDRSAGAIRSCSARTVDDRLQRAGGAEQVPGHRLGGGDATQSVASPSARADRRRLGDVADRGRGGVRVDVHDVGRRRCRRRAAPCCIARAAPAPSGSGCGDVVAVRGDAGAGELGVDPGAAGRRVLRALEHERRRRPRRARSRRGPCRTAGRRARARRCGSTAPASRRTPAIGSGWMAASVPPATTTSARPERIMSRRVARSPRRRRRRR